MFVQLCTKSVPNALKEHRIYNTLVKQNVFMSVLFIRWFLGSPPSGTYTSFTSPPCFIPPWTFLCLLTHQLYSYCLQGRLAYYIKQNLFRWIDFFCNIYYEKRIRMIFYRNVSVLVCYFKICQDYDKQVKAAGWSWPF